MKRRSLKAILLSIGGRLTSYLVCAWLSGFLIAIDFSEQPDEFLQDLGKNLGLNFLGCLKAFNIVLLQKWRWRLLSSPNALWVQVIKAYHGQEEGFDTNGCSFKGICVTFPYFQ
ncbi:hypothetical protein Tco_0818823, partial [Tanacetum coccineum]